MSRFDTPIGSMLAVADASALYLLEFTERKNLQKEIDRMAPMVEGKTAPLLQIQEELASYFAGSLAFFKTPFVAQGSSFQELVWERLKNIPFGETLSYSELASAIKKPSARRAVAKANSTNQLALIIPCHRVIHQNGKLGGYAGGVHRKKWLLEHEQKFKKLFSFCEESKKNSVGSKGNFPLQS